MAQRRRSRRKKRRQSPALLARPCQPTGLYEFGTTPLPTTTVFTSSDLPPATSEEIVRQLQEMLRVAPAPPRPRPGDFYFRNGEPMGIVIEEELAIDWPRINVLLQRASLHPASHIIRLETGGDCSCAEPDRTPELSGAREGTELPNGREPMTAANAEAFRRLFEPPAAIAEVRYGDRGLIVRNMDDGTLTFSIEAGGSFRLHSGESLALPPQPVRILLRLEDSRGRFAMVPISPGGGLFVYREADGGLHLAQRWPESWPLRMGEGEISGWVPTLGFDLDRLRESARQADAGETLPFDGVMDELLGRDPRSERPGDEPRA